MEKIMDIFQTECSKIPPAEVQKFTFSAPSKESEWKKVTALRLKNGDFQIEKLTDKQAFHEKISAGQKLFEHEIFSLFGKDFLQLEIITQDFSCRFRAAKKRILFQKNKLKTTLNNSSSHSSNFYALSLVEVKITNGNNVLSLPCLC